MAGNPPSHVVYVVSEPREGQDKGFWREIGAVFEHKDGLGFDVLIADQISVAGRLVCRPRQSSDAERPEQQQRSTRQAGPSGRR